MLRFGALGLVLIIAPSFKLGICTPFFLWIPYSSRNILSNLQDFLQPVRPVGIWFSRFSRFIESAGVEHWFLVIILIISPFSKLGIAYRFFSWIPHSSRNILSNFQDFLQPVRPVGIRFSRFIESASVEHWFLVIILIISPFSELGIAYRFFHGFLTLLETLYQIFKIFCNRFDGWHPVQPVQPVHQVSQCRTLIFGNYFDHISLFRTRNCAPFFFKDSSLFQEHSVKF